MQLNNATSVVYCSARFHSGRSVAVKRCGFLIIQSINGPLKLIFPLFAVPFRRIKNPEAKFDVTYHILLAAQLCGIEAELDTFPLPGPVSKPGKFIFELFEKANLTFHNKAKVIEVVDKMVAHLTNDCKYKQH